MVAESLLPHTRGRQTQAGRTVVLLAVSLLAVVAIIAVRPWAMPSDEPTELLDSILLPVPGGDAAEVSNLKSVVQGLLYRLNTLHDISAEWRQRVKSDVRVQRDAVFDIKQQASKVEKRPHQPWIPHATQVRVARSVSCSYHGWWCLAGRRSRSMPFPDNFFAVQTESAEDAAYYASNQAGPRGPDGVRGPRGVDGRNGKMGFHGPMGLAGSAGGNGCGPARRWE